MEEKCSKCCKVIQPENARTGIPLILDLRGSETIREDHRVDQETSVDTQRVLGERELVETSDHTHLDRHCKS